MYNGHPQYPKSNPQTNVINVGGNEDPPVGIPVDPAPVHIYPSPSNHRLQYGSPGTVTRISPQFALPAPDEVSEPVYKNQRHHQPGVPLHLDYIKSENNMQPTETQQSERTDERFLSYPHEFVPYRRPVKARCAGCGNIVRTVVTFHVGDGTYVAIIILCLTLPPFSLFPCCIESCHDAIHTCPNCNRILGSSKYCST